VVRTLASRWSHDRCSGCVQPLFIVCDDSETGEIIWTPTEAQGPGEHVFTVRVTDDGEGALNDEASFTVTVDEVNTAPTLAAIDEVSIDELTPLNVVLEASDPDLPTNALTYSLSEAPEGATIDAVTAYATASPPADPDAPVLLPGDPERIARKKRGADGIPIDDRSWAGILEAAGAFGLTADEVARLAG